MTMKIEISNCGPEFYKKDVVVKSGSSYDDLNVVCGLKIDTEEVQLRRSELDEVISALELIRNRSG